MKNELSILKTEYLPSSHFFLYVYIIIINFATQFTINVMFKFCKFYSIFSIQYIGISLLQLKMEYNKVIVLLVSVYHFL